ncbi:MAG TPA: hypothetical protein VMM80_11705, partial [Bacteroidota bacterium]|nr:hypothetical protein [Bacteroidota bacterium]
CLTSFGGARLYVLSPPPGGGAGRPGANNSSIVVRIVFGAVSFLFTGDAELPAERKLTRRYGAFLSSTVLKVSHHGSAGATGAGFLDRVHPDVALVSAGRMNRYGHPSPDLIRRLALQGTRVLRTDCAGAAILETDGRSLAVRAWRDEQP